MMAAPSTSTVRTEALAIRGAGPFRTSIRRKSPTDPGLVVGLERLDLDGLKYDFLCLIEPGELNDLVDAIGQLKDAIPEASKKLRRAA